jgi:hypothetical protein
MRRLWVAAAAISGFAVAALQVCPLNAASSNGLLVLALVPAVVQAPLVWRWRLANPVVWAVVTAAGVWASFYTTYAALFAIAFFGSAVSSLLGVTDQSTRHVSALWSIVLFLPPLMFLGGIGVGLPQALALADPARRLRWMLLTMTGAIPIAPLALPIVGLADCGAPFGIPRLLAGALGGAAYGAVTMLVLPRR